MTRRAERRYRRALPAHDRAEVVRVIHETLERSSSLSLDDERDRRKLERRLWVAFGIDD